MSRQALRTRRDGLGAMYGFVCLLTSFKGRICRAQWWLAFAIVLVSALAGSLVLDPGVWTAEPPRAPSVGLALWFAALVVPMTALSVKRFNDRDRPPWPGYACGALGLALIGAEQRGFMVDPSQATVTEHALFWLAVALLALAFVDNGFLKGTLGPNRYGPDPLARGPAAP